MTAHRASWATLCGAAGQPHDEGGFGDPGVGCDATRKASKSQPEPNKREERRPRPDKGAAKGALR